MEEYKKYFNLICYMIKNNFNQEFYSISQEIKRKLNINFSTIPLFVIF
ncbi:membrane protein [Streptococcus uberis]|nr:membrane protein [Streptococcus uberis]